ncbi:SDR family oxidoreductase [Nonomuraea sp. LPB2021202275-12-8]|uniref:SDR family oxidoreductase n=1 Tax=Nonomuraea sp. LPB2021202275-12-8 TaxID=3120159 RepID=UPI00300D6188
MAVALTMAQMKLAMLRHAFHGTRAQTAGTGAALGVLFAAGTVYLAFVSPDLLAAGYAVWLLGWMLGPVFMGGGDETLRPEYFSLLGLPPRRLATGLLVAAFVGVAPLVSLTALLGLLVTGARLGAVNALVAVPAMVLQLAVFVLLSKVGVAVVGLALRSRLGAIVSGLLNGAVLAALGQIWVFFWAFGQTGVPTAVWYLPSGWGLLAVQGHWWAPAALAVLVLLLLGLWAALLTRRMGAGGVRVVIVEPGFVATELADHITDPTMQAAAQNIAASMRTLQPEDIANAVVYAVTQPEHVAVNEILIRPTDQTR